MRRIDFDDGIGAVENKHGAGKDGWDNGTPGDPSSGTIPQDYWFDHIQEELCNVVEGFSGADIDGLSLDEVYQAIRRNVLKTNSSEFNDMSVPLQFDGGSALFVALDSDQARLSDLQPPSHTMRSMFETNYSDTNTRQRVFVEKDTGHWWFTNNVTWDETNQRFVQAQGSVGTWALEIRTRTPPTGLRFYSSVGGDGTWANRNDIQPACAPTIRGIASVPGGGTAAGTVSNISGITGLGVTSNPTGVACTYGVPFSGDPPVVQVTPVTGSVLLSAAPLGTSGFVVSARDYGGNIINPLDTSTPFSFNFTVFGGSLGG